MLATLLCKLRDSHPDIQLQLHPLLSGQQLPRLMAGNLDIGLLYPPLPAPGIESCHLLYDPVVMLVPDGHEIATARRITAPLLRKQSWITAPPWTEWQQADVFHESDIRLALYKACNRAGFEPKLAFETLDVDAALSLIKAGLGITLGMASLANAAKGVVARKMPLIELKLELVAAWRTSALSPAASIVLQMLGNR
jgi:DNA-binding transcriptional LysR family regulator